MYIANNRSIMPHTAELLGTGSLWDAGCRARAYIVLSSREGFKTNIDMLYLTSKNLRKNNRVLSVCQDVQPVRFSACSLYEILTRPGFLQQAPLIHWLPLNKVLSGTTNRTAARNQRNLRRQICALKRQVPKSENGAWWQQKLCYALLRYTL